MSLSRRLLSAAAVTVALAAGGSAITAGAASADAGFPCPYSGLVPYVGGAHNVVADLVINCPGVALNGQVVLLRNGVQVAAKPFSGFGSVRVAPGAIAPCYVGSTYQATMVVTATVPNWFTWHGWVPGYTSGRMSC